MKRSLYIKSKPAKKGSSFISQTNQLTKHIGMRLMYLLMELVKSPNVGLMPAILFCLVLAENNVNNMPLLCFNRFTICTIYSKEDCLLFFASAEEFSSPFAWKFEEELLSLLTKSDGRVERPAAASSEVSMRSWPSSRSACLFNSSNCRSLAYLQPF